jgi:uncharacterized ParB-like nuclease family protein
MKLSISKINGVKSWSYLAGINRPITPSQVTKLSKSIEKMGVVRPVIIATFDFITGKPQKYIIDGQHLFNACIRLNKDVPYTEISVKDKQDLVETIALLNASSKSWTMQDFILAWGSLKPDYIKLNKYYNVYDMDLRFLASVLENNSVCSSSISRRIKAGEFQIKNEALAVKHLDYVTDMLKVIPRLNRIENRYASIEYITFVINTPAYNHKVFLENLKKAKKQFILATHEEGQLKQLFAALNNK